MFVCASITLASRNLSDWWLSYWVTHTSSSQSTTLQTTPTYLLTAPTSVTTTLPHVENDLRFYLGVYGGLAAANSVS